MNEIKTNVVEEQFSKLKEEILKKYAEAKELPEVLSLINSLLKELDATDNTLNKGLKLFNFYLDIKKIEHKKQESVGV